MKLTNTLIILLVVSIIANVLQQLQIQRDIKLHHSPTSVELNPNFDNPTIIWNCDIEALPPENSLILLEFTKNDTIYIGPYDKSMKPTYLEEQH